MGLIVSGHLHTRQRERGDAEAFRHFLWRRHHQKSTLNGFVPELLASDGRVVRRMLVEDSALVFQQFDDPATSETIVGSVESRSSSEASILGYSLFAQTDAVAIMHTGGGAEPGWIAFPCPTTHGRPEAIPTLPLTVDETPRRRIAGGARLRWKGRKLVLEAALEERVEAEMDDPIEVSLLDHLVGWQFDATVDKDGRAKPVRLAKSNQPADGILRTGERRAEACFVIDPTMHNRLGDRDGLRAWFSLRFDRGLFCLPQDWCTWWFSVRFPRSAAR